MKTRATIIIPTFDHVDTLDYSVQSALDQTIKDIEIFVIGDGVPAKTKEIVRRFMKKDPRVKFFDHPKGPRHGEIYRHEALSQAKGEIVTYLSDDDLYFPDHVEIALKQIKGHDFIHTLPFYIDVKGRFRSFFGNLSIKESFESVMEIGNFIPLSVGVHTLEFYKRLPYGWRTTPEGTPTDLYMWRQILSKKDCKYKSVAIPTVLHLPVSVREEVAEDENLNELKYWREKIDNRKKAEVLRKEIIQKVVVNYQRELFSKLKIIDNYHREIVERDRVFRLQRNQIISMRSSLFWRAREILTRVSVFTFLRDLANSVLNRKAPSEEGD